MVHVVICDEKYDTINKILNGQKTMIIRAEENYRIVAYFLMTSFTFSKREPAS